MDNIFDFDVANDGSKGLVLIGDKAVVYRRDHNTTDHAGEIDLSGGGRMDDETPFATFQREVREEFGLAITKEQIVYGKRYTSSTDPNKHTHFIVAQLPGSAEDQVVFGDEGDAYMLMPLDEYLAREDAWSVYQERTRHYLESMNTQQ